MDENKMNSEEHRLATFAKWPTYSSIEATKLAKAGFYYTGIGNTVKCFSCKQTIKMWESEDRVIQKHRTLNPECASLFISSPTSTAVNEPKFLQLLQNDRRRRNKMRFEQHRLTSFANWPANSPIEAKKLAKAGFYYMDIDDIVKCFSCNQTIETWEYEDQAIQKHRTLNPECDFVLGTSDNVPISQCRSSIRSICTDKFVQRNETNSTFKPESLQNSLASTTVSVESEIGRKTWTAFADLLSEAERLQTFKDWPLSYIKPEDLAQNGFFYLRESDKVQCFFCRGIVGEFEPGDVVSIEHKKHFKNCPFIRGFNVGNIPITRNSEVKGTDIPPESLDDSWGGDVTGKFLYEIDVYSRPEKGRMSWDKLANLGIIQHSVPRHPNYGTYESRVKSFHKWPEEILQDPNKLAEAGFYYCGVSDHVRCFSCDGGLRNWEENDDPWEQHAKWFGKCCFLNLMKGYEFVKDIQMQHTSPAPAPQRESSMSESQLLEAVNTFMKTPIAKAALENGSNSEIIQEVVKKKIELTGSAFDDLNDLTKKCTFLSNTRNVTSELHDDRLSCVSTTNKPTTSTASIKLPEQNIAEIPNSSNWNSEKNNQMHAEAIEDQIKCLKEMRLDCKICMDNEIEIVFLPCGHFISCFKCASSLKNCPLCRTELKGFVRTFLS